MTGDFCFFFLHSALLRQNPQADPPGEARPLLPEARGTSYLNSSTISRGVMSGRMSCSARLMKSSAVSMSSFISG